MRAAARKTLLLNAERQKKRRIIPMKKTIAFLLAALLTLRLRKPLAAILQ